MAVAAFRVTVDATPDLLYAHPRASADAGDYTAKNVVLINVSTTQATVVLGDSSVTAATGARWVIEAGRTLSLVLEPGESLYAVVASGSQDIDVLANGR